MATPHAVTCNISGDNVTLSYNIWARLAIEDYYGNEESAIEAISGKMTTADLFRGIVVWISALVEGDAQEKAALGREPSAQPEWAKSPQGIAAALSPGDLDDALDAIVRAHAAGSVTAVKASAKKKTV